MIGALPRRLRALHNNNKPNFSPSGKSQERLNLIDRSTRLNVFVVYDRSSSYENESPATVFLARAKKHPE